MGKGSWGGFLGLGLRRVGVSILESAAWGAGNGGRQNMMGTFPAALGGSPARGVAGIEGGEV